MRPPAGFPDHPHRGFEILSYVLDGAMEHTDSAGHHSVIPAGGVQTVVAGRGIIHSEMPATASGTSGLQLWINLPRAAKQMTARYAEFAPDQIPEHELPNGRVRTLVGPGSPVLMQRPMVYLDIALTAAGEYAAELPDGYQGFAYVLAGTGAFRCGGQTAQVRAGDLLVWPPGDKAWQAVSQDDLRFVYAAGLVIGEEPVYNGPFVD
ncbi:MAG: pirin family protein [Alicyclobacillus sp.]|nr:pirin family protein [Alicyclobacillus sp.]